MFKFQKIYFVEIDEHADWKIFRGKNYFKFL